MNRSLVSVSLLFAVLIAPAFAEAQVGGSKLHIGAGIALDVGGEVEFDPGEDDLDATFGLRGHLDYAVHEHISVGGLLRMSWWEPDEGALDRSFLLDLGPRVIGHYDWRDFRFYGGISPGLVLSAIDDDNGAYDADNPAVGFTLSLTVAGMEYWFSRKVGLFAELGWIGHWFEHDIEGTDGEIDIELSQALLEFGFVFGV